ncbi:UDP-N-acetylmuramoyl-L-alanine--D-glutamate ligase [Rathayibacter toxicus]|uniref:UDP-N-acetylmuramoylalanine--D-glutamate ligase n=2 Tax=Rathayibacter toxicus TaxID=145458 RepID=A0A0C5BDZ6_9MICO|nr:UDP-N-acetylmuramoyl-L-alanine--D-glutamate ligase [Rathayibacter toxicus]AJM77476.1 UDP-N-acetylmuramoyl-L-alanyl-D-glutamate synthetase [Rathayibacter toxicus]KKM44708.1 UDP-N-acetylmuramoyl-L-alanyl-D-glutamate synthetase [Rathayibacter toxicus]PPG21554.1 UDP-N-acetylmuramoyl-L-alanine--D-glutamate ligase [Rathayibacter toxicus]PPG46518.1 UDP-N-acetylmuramoyl-L-alanine--D-glutamate ligase [Rathayibacter toxicus]PPH23595.1 UDP-N-acetylmuramoyl-L-alanine--D-glutamate ligase [Rathayibacter 
MIDPALTPRLDGLRSWHSDWRGLRVAVLGLGVTGFSAADTLAELGSDVLVLADRADEQRERMLAVIGARLHRTEHLDSVPHELSSFAPDLMIVSPGFRPTHPIIRWAQEAGIALWGDIELAWRLRDKVVRADGSPADWLVVTGTNGKTTTVQMTAAMLVAGGLRAAPCGNIGIPVLDAVRDPQGFDVLVVELSSYQLHYLGAIEPLASTCLNIADDHLDWHSSFEKYRAAKGKVYAGTRFACIYNRADALTEQMVVDADVREGARAIGFGLDVPGPSGFGVVDGILCDRAFLEDRRTTALELVTVAELAERQLAAPHIVQNVLAAAALSRACGVDPRAIRRALATFELDAHRVQLVAEKSGVTWVDDSKATNPHAANASLRAYPSVVWLVGGVLKGVDVDALVASHVGRLRGVVVIGAERTALLEAFRRHAPAVPVREVIPDDTGAVMQVAVEAAAALAREGDVVLLAPAAASMDQFLDYAARGRSFAVAVATYLQGGADDRSDNEPPGGRPAH